MDIQIEIDKASGFCFGVTTAIKKAEEELRKGEPLYCLGDIVHNAKEVERFVSEDTAVTDLRMKVFPIDAVENREMIEKLLKGLSQEYREVIKLRCYYGFSVKETAQILDISCDNVSKRMERARKQLQTKMEWEECDCEQKKYGLSVGENRTVGRRKTV